MPEQKQQKAPESGLFRQKLKQLWLHWFESDVEFRDDLSYMSSASAAVMEQSPRGGQQLLWAMLLFFIAMFVWAALAYVDEFTRGEGKVIPSSQIQVVQNLEGGIIAELFVREGEQVEAGQALLRMSDTRFSSSLREADVTDEQLRIKMARLKAEAKGIPFDVSGIEGVDGRLIDEEVALYTSRRLELLSSTSVLQEQREQKEQELSELRAKRDQLARSYMLLASELKMTKPLVKDGAISEVEVLRLERQANDLQGELTGAELAIPRVQSSLDEASEKLSNASLAFRSEAQKEFNEVSSELSRLKETSSALSDRVDRQIVRSPVAGTVKRLLITTLGGVIQPGMDILEIVPSEDSLQVEARIRPADIAFLHPGQKAMVKVTAYDFAVHGSLQGEVVHISPDTIVDEEGDSYYLVRVETDLSYLGREESPLPIIPGMTVSVDVLTGEKTILDYILKPILKTKQLALRER